MRSITIAALALVVATVGACRKPWTRGGARDGRAPTELPTSAEDPARPRTVNPAPVDAGPPPDAR